MSLSVVKRKNPMLEIKGPSEKSCFICGSTQDVRLVKFADKTFAGTLCMKHIAEKTSNKLKSEEKPK